MNILSIIAIAIVLPLQGISQKRIPLEPAPVNFVIKNAGFSVNGSMTGVEGFATIDAQNSDLLKLEGTIDPNTINTGINMRDNHLRKSEYFNVKDYPKISLASTRIKKISDHNYAGDFELNIKGTKKNISLPFNFSPSGNVFVVKGEFTINRLDFKIGDESIFMSDSVKVKIDLKTGQN